MFKSHRSVGHKACHHTPDFWVPLPLSLGEALRLFKMWSVPEGKACGLEKPACLVDLYL